MVWPTAGFFWEVWQRRHRAKSQRMMKITEYSSGMKERTRQGGGVLGEQLKGLAVVVRAHKRCQVIKGAEEKPAVVRS